LKAAQLTLLADIEPTAFVLFCSVLVAPPKSSNFTGTVDPLLTVFKV
jgi:hypothetical protein